MPDCQIVVGDCIEVMRSLPDASVQIVFADPPYNIGMDYGNGSGADSLSPLEYHTWCKLWMRWAVLKLAPGGALWVLINERWADEFGGMLSQLMPRRQRIIWQETFSQYMQTNFTTEHRHLFYHVKPGAKHTWNNGDIRVPSDRQLKYDDSRADPDGRVPGSVWKIGRLAGTHKKRGRVDWHPAQLPIELLERIVLSTSNPSDTVLDVFAGSGSMGVACTRHGRSFIGIELNEEYANMARRRIGDTQLMFTGSGNERRTS